MKLSKNLIYSFVIVLLCIISFSNILGNDFVWDDEKFIVDRPEIQSFSRAISSFTSDQYEIYRPFRTLVYATAFHFFRLNPMPYHLFSIVLHSTLSVLLFFMLKKLFNRKLAFLSAILFAIHPIHIGRVTNATGSFDIIGLIFYVLSFYLYILFREKGKKKFFITSLILFVIGLFSSEEIFTLPLMILLYEFVFHHAKWKDYLNSISYFVFLGGFLFLRIFILNIGSRVNEYPGGSFLVSMLTLPKVLLHYILLTFFPFGLTPFRGMEFASDFLSPWFIIPLIIFALLIYIVYRYREKKELLFFSGWFFITLLPFFNILPLPKIIAERYFYFASLAVFVLISMFILFIEKKNKTNAYGLFLVLVLFFIGMTIYSNTFWQDDYTLTKRGVELNPDSSRAHNNLGNYYFRVDDLEKAHFHFTKATETDPENYRAWENLGVLYSNIGQYDESIVALEKALEITPLNYYAIEKLGITYMRLGDNDTAEKFFKKAISLEPSYYKAYSRLGSLYGNKGNYSLALAYFEKAIEINPYYAEPYYNLGILYEINGKNKEAKDFYRKAASLDPGNELYVSRAR